MSASRATKRTGGTLLCVSVATREAAAEAIGERLGEVLGCGTAICTNAQTRRTEVTACLDRRGGLSAVERGRIRSAWAELRTAGFDAGSGRIQTRRLRREDWAESWKRHFKPVEISRVLLLKPSWSRRRPRRGQVVVVLDPGLSFGTGQHATTRFCLEQLATERVPGRAQSFLDIGTGSGILAIAAAKLGYRPVAALDFDPESVRVARENARTNDVLRSIRLVQADLRALPWRARETFDVIAANLTSDLLIGERRRILARLKPGGALVLAGILRRQFAGVKKEMARGGMKLAVKDIEGEWSSGLFRRRA